METIEEIRCKYDHGIYDLRYVCGNKKRRKQKQAEDQCKVSLEKEENALGYILCYLLLNGVMSMISLLLLKYCSNEIVCDISVIEINNILIAGFGGIILLRSSVFSFFKDNREISVGMITIVKSVLDKIETQSLTNETKSDITYLKQLEKQKDDEIILWKLNNTYKDYVKMIINKFKAQVSDEVSNAQDDYSLPDDVLNDILTSAYKEGRIYEDYDEGDD